MPSYHGISLSSVISNYTLIRLHNPNNQVWCSGKNVPSSFIKYTISEAMRCITLFRWCTVFIILFRSITMFCGIDSILQNILHIQTKCEEYSTNYCQSHRTLLWIWIMLWSNNTPYQQNKLSYSCPDHTNFPSTSGCEIVGDATMIGCQVVHTNISACSTFLLWCTAVHLVALPPGC